MFVAREAGGTCVHTTATTATAAAIAISARLKPVSISGRRDYVTLDGNFQPPIPNSQDDLLGNWELEVGSLGATRAPRLAY